MKKQTLQYTSAWEICKKLTTPGRAGDFIDDWDSVKPGDPLIGCCAVSTEKQKRKGNLEDQEVNFRRQAEIKGAIVVEVIKIVRDGRDPDWMLYLLRIARKYGAKVVAESTDRFIRHESFCSDDEKFNWLRATEAQLKEMKTLAYDVTLVTLCPPDATLKEVGSYRVKRGQAAKNRKGGRPKEPKPGDTKRRRLKWHPIALSLKQQGWSYAQIGAKIGRAKATVYGWIHGRS